MHPNRPAMTPARESIPANRAERLLASLAGVVSAHVVTDGAGRIVEIHVLAGAEVHPKQVVRNVESALSAGLGIEIDRRIVSVAQIRTPAAETGDDDGGRMSAERSADALAGGTGPAGRNGKSAALSGADASAGVGRDGTRLEYVKFHAQRGAEGCACDVILRDGERLITGKGSGPDTAAGRAEAAARGVLDAIVQARPGVRLELDGAVISASRGRSYVIVSAHALLDRITVPLAGAAPLARSPEEAGILAALQATNRWSS